MSVFLSFIRKYHLENVLSESPNRDECFIIILDLLTVKGKTNREMHMIIIIIA